MGGPTRLPEKQSFFESAKSQSDTVKRYTRRHCFLDWIPGTAAGHTYTINNRGPPQAFLKISEAGGHPRAAQNVFILDPQITAFGYRIGVKKAALFS